MQLPKHLMNNRTKGIACVLYSVFVWAGWMVASRYSVQGSLTTFDITALRFGVAGAVLLPTLWRRGLRVGPYGRWGSLILAVLMGVPFNLMAIYAMKFAPASHAGIINISMLTLTTLVGIFLLRERTHWLRVLGLILSVSGVICILEAKPMPLGSEAFTGHIFFILSGLLWAGYILTVRAWKADALHATAIVCCLSGLAYVPVYLAFLPVHLGMENIREVLFQGVYQGIINSVFAMFLFNRAVALLGASTSSAFLPLVPAIATLLAIPVLGEWPGGLEVLGIGLATLGVLLATGILHRARG